MKKILYSVLALLLLSVTSCMDVDNWDAPDATVRGKITDSYTGENILTTQGDWGIRIWERTWTKTVPNSQSLNVKQDGSYTNTKLFKGTYDMLPYGGPFWPVDTIKGVQFGGNTEQNFTVTPYLQLLDFTPSLTGLKLVLKCKLKAPIRDGLPNLVELKPFLSLTQFCGAGPSSFIDIPDFNNQRKQYNQSWADAFGADTETTDELIIGPLPVKAGYTYYVRLGANVNDANRKYNYSEIVKIEVPADAVNPPEPPNFKNRQWPFQRDDWDGTRWGNLQNWTTNAAMRTRDGRGGYDAGWEGLPEKQSLGFEYWNNNETPIINGKLFQTFPLPAGTYKFTMSLGGDNPIKTNGGNDPRYIAAAVGTTLPDIADLATALASTNFAGLDQNGLTSIQFVLAAPATVSIGFVVNFTSDQQNVRASWVNLEQLF